MNHLMKCLLVMQQTTTMLPSPDDDGVREFLEVVWSLMGKPRGMHHLSTVVSKALYYYVNLFRKFLKILSCAACVFIDGLVHVHVYLYLRIQIRFGILL